MVIAIKVVIRTIDYDLRNSPVLYNVDSHDLEMVDLLLSL